MSPYDCTKRRILDTIKGSEVPEDYPHAINTLEWITKLGAYSDPLLEIAALGHDIERSMAGVKARKSDFPDYESFKAAHAENSARIVAQIMRECGWDEGSVEKVARMIRLHETGGDQEADVLRDADALSFFEVNLPYYFQRHDMEEVERRCRWGYSRISAKWRDLVREFRYSNEELNRLLERITGSAMYAEKG